MDLYTCHSIPGVSSICKLSPYYVKRVLVERDIPPHSRAEDLRFSHIDKYGSEENYRKAVTKSIENTVTERYGVRNVFQHPEVKEKIKSTNVKRYGAPNIMQSEMGKSSYTQSCMNSLGVSWPTQSSEVLQKRSETNLIRYGGSGWGSPQIKEKCAHTVLMKYGVSNVMQSPEVKETLSKNVNDKYGVPWYCMHPNCRVYSTNDSVPNRTFGRLLAENNIEYTTEFIIERKSFDFKVGNVLIEIDPTPTHNIRWTPFNKDSGIDPRYHRSKSDVAERHGYRCIHVWDWDDTNKIISLLKPRQKLYARKCIVKEISIPEAREFINKYHLQNYATSRLCIGLFYNNQLVSVMTFGTPRYNKKYEYELIRYCSSHYVIGGANKLLKYFVDNYHPKSIISYCDTSKFTGKIYSDLGFTEQGVSLGKHWFNAQTNSHITDNLLRQRGFDQLLGDVYGKFGKGTSNEELMRNFGYDEIIDAGQKTFILNLSND